ncbi:hypothetical protein MK489_11630 [Myxococcota bacterium]|nr:hypothetical protein [Myxococcota bacterium]
MCRSILVILGVVGALACATPVPHDSIITTCEPSGPARPLCNFQNPEDMVVLPGHEGVIVSEFGAMEGGHPGRLSLLVLDTEERRVLFEGSDGAGTTARWGDANCPGPPPPDFSPHGIYLSQRADGALQLLAVQHSGREAIEFFEVFEDGRDTRVEWRGCAEVPGLAWLNSVAALPGGGFVTTEMMSREGGMEAVVEGFTSGDPVKGRVWQWLPSDGWSEVPGSEMVLPNGIEVSADGRELFVNASGDNEVVVLSRESHQIVRRVSLPGTDNARWATDGRLVVASLVADPAMFHVCVDLHSGACPLEFQIVAIDPDSMETEVLYHNQGAPMGGGTVGLVVGDDLFVGSFAGDRLLRVKLAR